MISPAVGGCSEKISTAPGCNQVARLLEFHPHERTEKKVHDNNLTSVL